MREKWKSFIRSLNPSNFLISLLLIALSPAPGFARNGWIPLDDTSVRLPDGRELQAIRKTDLSHVIVLKRGKTVLWQQTFEDEYDRSWQYAFFVPLKPNRYAVDLDRDGIVEVAIATWDGGNAMSHRTALIFTVQADTLKLSGEQRFNLEFGESVFP